MEPGSFPRSAFRYESLISFVTEGGRVPIENAAYFLAEEEMISHTFRVEWQGGPSATVAVAELSRIEHGLPGLRSNTVGDWHSLSFDGYYWRSDAKLSLDFIQRWIRDHGAVRSVILIDQLTVEEFMFRLLRTAHVNLTRAAIRMKQMRRLFPNKADQADRMAIEATIEQLRVFVGD